MGIQPIFCRLKHHIPPTLKLHSSSDRLNLGLLVQILTPTSHPLGDAIITGTLLVSIRNRVEDVGRVFGVAWSRLDGEGWICG